MDFDHIPNAGTLCDILLGTSDRKRERKKVKETVDIKPLLTFLIATLDKKVICNAIFFTPCLPCYFFSSFRPRLFQSTLCTTVSSKCSIAQGGAATVSTKCSIARGGAADLSAKCSIAQSSAPTLPSKCSLARRGAGNTRQWNCTSRYTLQIVCEGGPNHFRCEVGISTFPSKCSMARGGAGMVRQIFERAASLCNSFARVDPTGLPGE